MREKFHGLVDYAPRGARESIFASLTEFGAGNPHHLMQQAVSIAEGGMRAR
jgi:hypothetical protein